jgi:DNA repair exonuclease SbcCD ATPase subunit
MRIVRLECRNFKCFEGRAFELTDDAVIHAENGHGKTSIAEAVAFALFGTNITGSPVGIDDYIRKGAKDLEVVLTVEIGDETHEIVRTKGKSSAVYLNGRKSDSAAVAGLIGDKAEFLSVFTPGYFAALSKSDQREMVMGLVQLPAKAEVLARLSDSEQKLLENEPLRDPEAWAKTLREEIKTSQKEQDRARGQIELLEPRVAAELPSPVQWDGSELAELLAARDSKRTVTADQVREVKEQIGELRRQYTFHQSKLQPLPDAPYRVGDECPTCSVPLTQESLNSALHTHAGLVAQIEHANDTHKRAMADIESLGKKFASELDQLAEASLQEGDAILDARIGELEARRFEVERHNAEAQAVSRRIEEDRAALSDAQKWLDDCVEEEVVLKGKLAALTQYRAQMAELQVAQLKQHLDKVAIQLFDVVKSTGEIKPTFDLLYEGREYRTLSYSERIRANLEIATLTNRVREWDWPVFIDNAESITHYTRPAATQVIEAHVVAGAELTVGTKEDDAA